MRLASPTRGLWSHVCLTNLDRSAMLFDRPLNTYERRQSGYLLTNGMGQKRA